MVTSDQFMLLKNGFVTLEELIAQIMEDQDEVCDSSELITLDDGSCYSCNLTYLYMYPTDEVEDDMPHEGTQFQLIIESGEICTLSSTNNADGVINGFSVFETDGNACKLYNEEGDEWTYAELTMAEDGVTPFSITGPEGKQW